MLVNAGRGTHLAIIVLLANRVLLAGTAERASDADGWKTKSPRTEIQPSFEFKPDGGPAGRGSLIIRADGREGVDGHWTKTLPIKGGRYYRFRALRKLENVSSPRRSTLARILWRDEQDRPVRHDEPGAKSYAPDKAPEAEPEYPHDPAT